MSPLTDLLSTSKSFKWSTECDNAFKAAKDLLCHAPVLSAPNFDLPFKLLVDISATVAGAVLLQEDSCGIDHPICYFEVLEIPMTLQYDEEGGPRLAVSSSAFRGLLGK